MTHYVSSVTLNSTYSLMLYYVAICLSRLVIQQLKVIERSYLAYSSDIFSQLSWL